jgi:hypothetical protein
LGGLAGSELGLNGDGTPLNAGSLAAATQETDDPTGFQGIFFWHVPSELLHYEVEGLTFYFVSQHIFWRARKGVRHAERSVCVVQRLCALYQ